MNNKIKISFVVPVYNTGQYLMYCLGSLVRQTLKDIEIICVDDGSTDNSLEIIQDFASRDNRIKVILQEHKGTSTARNAGLKSAEGEYIHFVDSDDWICDNCAELTYNKAKSADFDLICFNVANYDNKTMLIRENQFYPPAFWPKNCEKMILSWKNYKNPFLGNFSVANKIYKTEFLKNLKLQFIENIWFEDHPFHLATLLGAKKIGVINRSLYFYRKNIKNSFMATMRKDSKIFSIFNVFEELWQIVLNNNLEEDLRKDYVEYTICLGLNMFINSCSWGNKRRFYLAHRQYCKNLVKNSDNYMVLVQSKIYINFLEVLKLPWFMFLLNYCATETSKKLKNKIKERLNRKNAKSK